jgi:hypothetical protein
MHFNDLINDIYRTMTEIIKIENFDDIKIGEVHGFKMTSFEKCARDSCLEKQINFYNRPDPFKHMDIVEGSVNSDVLCRVILKGADSDGTFPCKKIFTL